MSMAKDNAVLKGEFESLLGAARRRVHVARVRGEIVTALEAAMLSAALLSGAFALLALGAALSGRAPLVGWREYVVVLPLAVLAPAALILVQAYRRLPTLREAAERLDLAAADHNRVAIAFALLDADGAGAFGRAAIDDGRRYLQRLHAEAPYVSPASPSLRRTALRAGLCVVLTVIGGALLGAAGTSLHAEPAIASAGFGRNLPTAAARRDEDALPQRTPAPKPPAQARLESGDDSRASTAAATQNKGKSESALGQALAGRLGQAENTQQQALAAGEATSAAARAQSRKGQAKPATKKMREPRSEPNGVPPPKGTQESSAVSGGSSGTGAMSPIQHDWAMREQSLGGEPEEEDTDAPVDDERESNTQRGGVQPALKDRQEAPSRDLGISGDQGPPGTGRGGPTPPKKSRGTASLVLGVPIPDFVRGRTGPGTTKVAHERVEPSASDGARTETVPTAARSLPEAPFDEILLPPEWRRVVRDYLLARHVADQTESEPRPAKE